MLKKTFISFLFLLVLSFANYAQESCNKVDDTSLAVSLCAPAGWTSEVDSEGDTVIMGDAISGLTPNIIITSESSPELLPEYSKFQANYLLKNYKALGVTSLELMSRTEFKSGIGNGFKTAFKCFQKDNEIWIIQYHFSGAGSTKILVNVTLSLAAKNKLGKIIDDSVASLRKTK